MLQISKRSKTFVFLSLIQLILFFFLNRKSFFVIFDNIQIIKSMNFSLLHNEKKKYELTELISDFDNKKDFWEMIV